MPSFRARLAIPLAAFLVGLISLGAAAYVTLTPSARPAGSQIGGAFRLTAPDGRKVTDKDLDGSPHLVFFGFTRCPDICPTKLFEMSEMFRAMGERGPGIRAVFITVDPERDTPAALGQYVQSFDKRILPLTGTPAEIEAVTKAYRAFARKVPTKDGDYTMEHTALVYLMDKRGDFVGSFNLDRPPEKAAEELLKQG